MKKFDVLYARNSNGKINEWRVVAQQMSDACIVVISEGLIDGEKTATSRACKGKNIGKMNETTAYEQACKDAQSRWELKKKKGYKSLEDLMTKEDKLSFEEIPLNEEGIWGFIDHALPKNRTDANNLNKPMLASPMFDAKTGKSRAKFPMIGQPKLNGFRIMCRWEKVIEGEGIFKEEVEKPIFRSREGIRFDTLKHIEVELTKDMFFYNGEEVVLDGELYFHGFLLQRINSAVNKFNVDTYFLKFYIFDLAIENMQQKRRDELRFERFDGKNEFETIICLNSVIVKDIEEAQFVTNRNISLGFEGSILRDPKGLYQFGKRNSTMLKLKRFQDKEFLVLDVVGGDNSPTLGVFVCQAENGKSFKCTPQGTHEVKAEYLANKHKYIGKKLQVKFYERTSDGIPFHTTGLCIREFL